MGIPVDSLIRFSTDPARGAIPFTAPGGALIDPTTVTLTYQDPTGTKTSVTGSSPTYTGLVHDSTGVFHLDVDSTGKPGDWFYEWKSTGAGQAAGGLQKVTVDSSILS